MRWTWERILSDVKVDDVSESSNTLSGSRHLRLSLPRAPQTPTSSSHLLVRVWFFQTPVAEQQSHPPTWRANHRYFLNEFPVDWFNCWITKHKRRKFLWPISTVKTKEFLRALRIIPLLMSFCSVCKKKRHPYIAKEKLKIQRMNMYLSHSKENPLQYRGDVFF